MLWSTRQRWFSRAILVTITALTVADLSVIVQEFVTALAAPRKVQLMLRLLLTAGFWACSLIGCWFACLGLHQWRESKRILKIVSSRERRAMSTLCRISEANRVVYGSQPLMFVPAVIGLLAASLLKEPRWLGVTVMAAGLRWWLWVRTTTPPFVLFLSTSDPRSIDIHRQIKRLISPLRVVTLLDLGNSPSSQVTNELLLDCLRTGNDDDWWKAITVLIELVPLVVVNADTESPGVVRETMHLISEDITFKTVFLTKGDPRLLRLEPEPAASASGCYVASASTLQDIIQGILNTVELPGPRRSVRSFTSLASGSTGVGESACAPIFGRSGGKANQLLLEGATCSQCKSHMTIFLGVARKGMFPAKVFVHDSHRGCFRCSTCSRYYCWDCSDSRMPCSCGSKAWLELQYFPAGVSPEQALKDVL